MLLDITRIARPTTFVWLLAGYLGVGAVCSYAMDSLGYAVSIQFVFYTACALALYYLGCRYVISIPQRVLLPVFMFAFVIMTFRDAGFYAFAGLAATIAIVYRWDVVVRRCGIFGAVGVSLLIVNLALSGTIPLLHPEIRYGTQTVMFVFGYALAFLGTTYMYSRDQRRASALAAATFAVLLLYGFRSYLLILVLSLSIQSLIMRPPSIRNVSAVLIATVSIVIVLGFIVVALLPQQLPHTLASLPFYRCGFTTHMLDEACRMAGATGRLHGEIWTLSKTSPLIGTMLAKAGNITTTLIGPFILDGGIFELPVMVFFGAAMNTVHTRAQKSPAIVPLYAIAFSIMVISVDISPVPLIVLMFLLALLIINRCREIESKHVAGYLC